jgi:hypothetical protein
VSDKREASVDKGLAEDGHRDVGVGDTELSCREDGTVGPLGGPDRTDGAEQQVAIDLVVTDAEHGLCKLLLELRWVLHLHGCESGLSVGVRMD